MNAYILIGGSSRRMRRSKSELFLARIVDAACPVFDAVIAVQRSGGEAATIETIFEEPHAEDGALFGVAYALRHSARRCVILAVDYPLVTSAVLAFLRERVESSPAPLVVPMWDGQPQPLCAGYDPTLLSEIERRLARGERAVTRLLEGVSAEMIPEATLRQRFSGEPLMNVNTPEELERAERIYGSEGFLSSR